MSRPGAGDRPPVTILQLGGLTADASQVNRVHDDLAMMPNDRASHR